MGFLSNIFGSKPYPSDKRQEVEGLINDLIRIGKQDDFLAERPGGAIQCAITPYRSHPHRPQVGCHWRVGTDAVRPRTGTKKGRQTSCEPSGIRLG